MKTCRFCGGDVSTAGIKERIVELRDERDAHQASAKKSDAARLEAERVLAALADTAQQQAEEWNRERDALKAEVERLREALATRTEQTRDYAGAIGRIEAAIGYAGHRPPRETADVVVAALAKEPKR